jgi:chloramphenicol-sensitive protein RarD
VPDARRGFLYGVAAYLLWGLFPLYWPLLEPAGAVEILAHRVAWSVLTMLVVVAASRRLPELRALFRRHRARNLLTVAAVLIAVNWGTYIYGVNNHRVVETSLGYFINPLVTVLMGVLVLRERLRRWQWAAVGIATVAVVGLAVEYGHLPWIALVLAFSFGTYGLAKKQADVDAVESLTFETLVLAPVALGYLFWLGASGDSHFTGHGAGHVLLLASSGVVTALPLLCFGGAATRVPLTRLGLMQYLTPTIQFILGVTVLGESMSAARWIGFAVIWVALALFTADSMRQRQLTRLRVEASVS